MPPTATLAEREPLLIEALRNREFDRQDPYPEKSFGQLLREIHEKTRQTGLDKMTMEEIDAEIATSRRERRERKLARSI